MSSAELSPSTRVSADAATTTDPGFDAVESLYRGATGRSGLRAYEPSLRPPEGTDDYGWLFRPDEPVTLAPAPPTTGAVPTSTVASLLTTTSGRAAAVGAAPLVRWSPGTRPTGRRWPAVALLAAALTCALLLPWAVSAL